MAVIMMGLRYRGEFGSQTLVQWRCEIWQEGFAGEAGELMFPADEPLLIEWEGKEKWEVIQGSMATLRLLSPGDRTYIDLYTLRSGNIRLDVYRNESKFWSGCLDPELYEEPYSYKDMYEVSLKFSDFGVLKRTKFNLSGIVSIERILNEALTKAGINHSGVVKKISTYVNSINRPEVMSLADYSVVAENFTDEEGEVMWMSDVLDGVLQPFAMRIVQREGKILLYDLNAMSEEDGVRIGWNRDDAVLGVDKVYNNVRVVFSPYSDSTLMSGGDDSADDLDPSKVNSEPSSSADMWSWMSKENTHDTSDTSTWDIWYSFNLYRIEKPNGIKSVGSNAMGFHILPINNGDEKVGVAWNIPSCAANYPTRFEILPNSKPTRTVQEVYTTERVFLARQNDDKVCIRLAIELLADMRYNPFVDYSDQNLGKFETERKRCGHCVVPIVVSLYDAQGNVKWHFRNFDGKNTQAGNGSYGSWVEGPDPLLTKMGSTYNLSNVSAILDYYAPDDIKETAGIMNGWAKNKAPFLLSNAEHSYSFHKKRLTSISYDGMPIACPPEAGYVEVKVIAGLWIYDGFGENAGGEKDDWEKNWSSYWNQMRWILYSVPKMEICRKYIPFEKWSSGDIEYSGVSNGDAEDDLEIETICGTSESIVPGAKGLIYQNGWAFHLMKRGGVLDGLEKLLIGTVCSQYGSRHTTLQGTVESKDGMVFEDASHEGKFLLISETMDCVSGNSECLYSELHADEYESE